MMNKKGVYDLAWNVVMLAVKDTKGIGYLSRSELNKKRALYFLEHYEQSFWYDVIPLSKDDIKTLLSFDFKRSKKIKKLEQPSPI